MSVGHPGAPDVLVWDRATPGGPSTTLTDMADALCLPSTPMATSPLRREGLQEMAMELALDAERDRRRVTRAIGVGIGVGLAATTVGLCIGVGGLGAWLLPVGLLATALGLSTAMFSLALLSAGLDGVVRMGWRATARRHGLDAAMADQVLEDARSQLYEEERSRLERLYPTSMGPERHW